jgi:hypothetical protein
MSKIPNSKKLIDIANTVGVRLGGDDNLVDVVLEACVNFDRDRKCNGNIINVEGEVEKKGCEDVVGNRENKRLGNDGEIEHLDPVGARRKK